jgi:hypothetical protein
MVYGRYNYSIHGVYKPTNITGGHHPVGMKEAIRKSRFDQTFHVDISWCI